MFFKKQVPFILDVLVGSTFYHGVPRSTKEHQGVPRSTTEDHGGPRRTTEDHGGKFQNFKIWKKCFYLNFEIISRCCHSGSSAGILKAAQPLIIVFVVVAAAKSTFTIGLLTYSYAKWIWNAYLIQCTTLRVPKNTSGSRGTPTLAAKKIYAL